MRIEERVGLAHLAYHRAVVRARAEATAAAWRGLVTAAKNLRMARRDRDGSRGAAKAAPAPGPRGELVWLRTPLTPSFRRRWPDLAREFERARALVDQMRELLRETQRLRAELADFVGGCRLVVTRKAAP
jgi:hypothetical protein